MSKKIGEYEKHTHSRALFGRTWQTYPKMYTEMQKAQKNQNNIEKAELPFDLEDFHLPKSYSYQDSVVQA